MPLGVSETISAVALAPLLAEIAGVVPIDILVCSAGVIDGVSSREDDSDECAPSTISPLRLLLLLLLEEEEEEEEEEEDDVL